MATGSSDTPLVVILGITGSGKSALGLGLAERFGGEIIAADSRTIYRGMDISTAKPTLEERSRVPHYLIDVVSPNETFTVADFKFQAQKAINIIEGHGKVPFLVGGTGLYIDALLYNFKFRPVVADDELRMKLSKLSVAELRHILVESMINLPRDDRNPRRLIRAIETNGTVPTRSSLRKNTLILGLPLERDILRERITARVDRMVDMGLVKELSDLTRQYDREAPSLQTPACKAFKNFLEGHGTLEQAKEDFIHNDMNLAKRQQTWFKRNKDVHWLKTKDEAVELVTTFLNK